MKEFLFTEKFDAPNSDMFLVKAKNAEEAYIKAAKAFYKDDEMYRDDIFCRAVNMSWAERFFLQTDHEVNYFGENGEVLIDHEEFKKRVKEYFAPYTEAAEEYLSYWFLDATDEETEAAFEHLFNNHSDFWAKEWIKFTDFRVIDTSEIKRISK